MQGVELETLQIDLDGTPGVRGNQIVEVVGQLRWRQVVDLVIEVVPHAPDSAGISIDGLGLKALEFEVLEVTAVRAAKGIRIRARVEPAGVSEHGQTPGKLRGNMRHN
jgi:hypothetical protein